MDDKKFLGKGLGDGGLYKCFLEKKLRNFGIYFHSTDVMIELFPEINNDCRIKDYLYFENINNLSIITS